jgi:four helix bundle protein
MQRGFDHERLAAFELAADVYSRATDLVRGLPGVHRHLMYQLLRASSSIALNLAEGTAEYSRGDKARFYRIALRSTAECGAIIHLLRRVNAVNVTAAAQLRQDLLRLTSMITALILRTHPPAGRTTPTPRQHSAPPASHPGAPARHPHKPSSILPPTAAQTRPPPASCPGASPSSP